MTNDCQLYPYPYSLADGLIESITGWTAGPRGCILGKYSGVIILNKFIYLGGPSIPE